jgi:hypothetical protein
LQSSILLIGLGGTYVGHAWDMWDLGGRWDMWDLGGRWDRWKDYPCCPVNDDDWCDFAKAPLNRAVRVAISVNRVAP